MGSLNEYDEQQAYNFILLWFFFMRSQKKKDWADKH